MIRTMRLALITLSLTFLFSCRTEKMEVDMILSNGFIYTVDSNFTIAEAMAVNNGTIVATGKAAYIHGHYKSKEHINLNGKTILPGFTDAHCHFVGYALSLMRANLVGTKSFEEVLQKTTEFAARHPLDGGIVQPDSSVQWLLGRGWDQNNWPDKQWPDKTKLDSLYPNTPVLLTRIDGHAALANSKALSIAGITANTKINGGEILLKNGQPTGVLIDNAVDLVSSHIPPPNRSDIKKALLLAQENCLAFGLTTLHEAGLMKADVDLLDALQQQDKLKLRFYVMLSDSQPNFDYYLTNGPYQTDRMNVRSFKLYADGALGSRGACLLEPYNDNKSSGFLLNSPEHFEKRCTAAIAKGFQVNTHCIGDSAYRLMLSIYKKAGADSSHRWRIEHAQITHPDDIRRSKHIVPSVQPTHATSDMYWASQRIGKRTKYAYAYKSLLNASGLVALGTDFPVEDIAPFKTFYAAVTRKDVEGYPIGGFQPQEALTREETLMGMTLWPAKAAFEEKQKGSLEKGKMADFVILDRNIMTCTEREILQTRVLRVFIGGELVFDSDRKGNVAYQF